jgi:hypothetical protein
MGAVMPEMECFCSPFCCPVMSCLRYVKDNRVGISHTTPLSGVILRAHARGCWNSGSLSTFVRESHAASSAPQCLLDSSLLDEPGRLHPALLVSQCWASGSPSGFCPCVPGCLCWSPGGLWKHHLAGSHLRRWQTCQAPAKSPSTVFMKLYLLI